MIGSERIADAIAEHYRPLGPSDDCPTKPVSVVAALADKIDTLVGFFAIGEKPTGSRDPFALRRAALGVIRIILENRLRVPLACRHLLGPEAGRVSLRRQSDRNTVVVDDLLAFIADRLKVHLRDQGVGTI